MRFAIWTAVSKPAQAKGWDKPEEEKEIDDKESLFEQEKRSRALGQGRGWVETSGPYVAPGKSRTKYVNLRDAEEEIPALHELLEDAKMGKYDVLIIYDYNRLRDLLDSVAKTLGSYGVQIASVNQFVEPQDPEDFDPYASDSESMMRGNSQMMSRWQIADLRRKYRYGSKSRVDSGLPSLRIPYGYAKPPGRDLDPKAIPVQVPDYIAIITEIKNNFFAGKSYYDIRDSLNDRGIPSPQNGKHGWTHTAVKKILINPFYAGKVFFGLTKTIRDPNNNSVRLVKNPNPHVRPGKHQPIFTPEEHQAILIEVERREHLPHRNRYHFAGLLVCSVCGAHLVHDHGVWRCKPRGAKKDHIGLTMKEALALIPRALQRAMQEQTPGESVIQPTQSKKAETDLQELERKRRLIQSRLEAEIYTDEEAAIKIKAVNAEIQALKSTEGQHARKQVQRQEFMKSYEQAKGILQHLPQWMKEQEPRKVNTFLLRLCRQITVTPDATFTIYFRD